jgi:hypothetical protein
MEPRKRQVKGGRKMKNSREVVHVEPPMIPVMASPTEIVINAQAQATALMDIVEKKELYAVIGSGTRAKKYLEYEAWQLIGAFNNAFANTEYVRPLYESPASAAAGAIDTLIEGEEHNESGSREILAYEAKVNIVKHGEVLASAVMVCGMDSFPTKGRKGIDRDRAAMSAAQTWAASKAFRMVYSYIAVLADYEPTPAAEMQSGAVAVEGKVSESATDNVVLAPTRDVKSPFEAFKTAAKEMGYNTVEAIEGATGMELAQIENLGVDELRVKFRELRVMAGETSD